MKDNPLKIVIENNQYYIRSAFLSTYDARISPKYYRIGNLIYWIQNPNRRPFCYNHHYKDIRCCRDIIDKLANIKKDLKLKKISNENKNKINKSYM